jgi:hypothetical protein
MTGHPDQSSPKIDTSVPHAARIWNYWLGSQQGSAGHRQNLVQPRSLTNVPIGDVTTRPSAFRTSSALRTVVSATS